MKTGFFGLVWLITSVGMVVFYASILIIAWRFMRAHEKIADKLQQK